MADKKRYYEWHTGYYYGLLDEVEPFLESTLVLDVGCGTGWFGNALRQYNPQVTVIGVDNDSTCLRKAEANEVFPVFASAKKLPFKNNTFDGVVAKAVLEHLSSPLQTVVEFNRVLKPKGRLFVSVPDLKSRHFWDDYTHVRPFTSLSLRRVLEDGGFIISKIWYTSSFPGLGILLRIYPNKDRVPGFVKFLGKLGISRQNIDCVAIKTH